MKKPYIKKLCNISSFKVWLVDGNYIRKNLDEEFTNFGQHYLFKFIPKNELWIDKERVPGEEKFYIDSMLAMERFLAEGKSLSEAIKKSDAIERRERAKSQLMKGKIKVKKTKEEILKVVHKKPLNKYGDIKIWIVDGELVRDLLFIEFTEGGHGLAYSFIPKDEIWIDDDVLEKERKFILLHEMYERNLMDGGMKYEKAHKKASEIEFYCRHHPKQINKKLKEEIKKMENRKARKVVVGYIFNEPYLTKDDKIFFREAKKKNIEIIPLNVAKDINEEKIEEIVRSCDIFYNNSAEEFSMEIVKTIEELGKMVIDSSKKFYYDEDKWMFFLKCKKHKIPTPRTILLSENINIAKKELKQFNCWPVILKRIEGTMGLFVDKAENLEQAEKIMNKFWKEGSERLPIIAQEFIKSPSYRVTTIGGKIAQTAIKQNKGWKATGIYLSDKNIKKFPIDARLRKLVKKIIKVFDIKVCGIDLLKRDGKWLVLEINSDPAFDFFPKERKKLIREVLDFLKKNVKVIKHKKL